MTDLYLGYDQAGLDAQLNLRAAVPDAERYFKLYEETSAEARATLPCRLDVAFGPSPEETLDIFPAADPGAPIHVFIHGGYWRAFSKNEFSGIARGLAPAGATTMIVNYALAPAVDMAEIVRQCRAALAWAWRHGAEHNGDKGRIFVSGHSAGGHLTAMMAATDWPAFDAELPADLVKGGCAISGIYELEPIRLSYLNADIRLAPDDVARFSPIRLRPARMAPLLLCVGDGETDEFRRQQDAYRDALADLGHQVGVVAAPGLHHFNVVDELARSDAPLNRAVREQMSLTAIAEN